MRVLLLLALLGCATDPAETVCPVIEDCGEAPQAPGFVAAFDGDTVTMSRTSYTDITAWRDEVLMWNACIAGR